MIRPELEALSDILQRSQEDLNLRYNHRFPTGYVQYSLQKGKALALEAHKLAKDGPSFDLGCGDGMWALFMAALGRGSYGIDIDSALIFQARENHKRAVKQGLIDPKTICRFQAGNFYPHRYHEELRGTIQDEFSETVVRWTKGDVYDKLGISLKEAAIVFAYIWPAHMPLASRMLQRECERDTIVVLPLGGDIALNHGLRGEVLEEDVYGVPIMLRKGS